MADPVTGTGWDQWLLIIWAMLFPLALLIGGIVSLMTRTKRK